MENRDRQDAIFTLSVPSDTGSLVELRNIAEPVSARGPAAIERYARQRQVTVQSNLIPGYALGNALQELDPFVQSLDLPPEYRYEFLGEAKLMKDSNSNFLLAFLLAFAFMYMILAVQFESLVHPITILLAVPLTLPFALVSLFFLQTPLDVYAMIGLFMLFGIVKKNGILQVDYTNVLRARPAAGRSDPEGERDAPAADPDDDRDARDGDGADRDGAGPRCERPRQHGEGDPRRTVALTAALAAGHTRGLLAVGRLHDSLEADRGTCKDMAEPQAAGAARERNRSAEDARSGGLVSEGT